MKSIFKSYMSGKETAVSSEEKHLYVKRLHYRRFLF